MEAPVRFAVSEETRSGEMRTKQKQAALLLEIPPLSAVVGGEDLSWQAYANCLGVDPDLFFPERGASTREAKAVCRRCIVRTECLEYALQNAEKFGIWGGLSERERRRIRKLRAQRRREKRTANGKAGTRRLDSRTAS
jgi:WhiB family redox-sensing transcriptional regulator